MRIYLDCCCFGRLYDATAQQRVRDEADAVELLLGAVERKRLELISSEFLYLELSRHPDARHRIMCLGILGRLSSFMPASSSITSRASSLETLGLTAIDAAHVASACEANAEFLSVDDVLLRKCHRHAASIPTPVDNPLAWMQRRFPDGL